MRKTVIGWIVWVGLVVGGKGTPPPPLPTNSHLQTHHNNEEKGKGRSGLCWWMIIDWVLLPPCSCLAGGDGRVVVKEGGVCG